MNCPCDGSELNSETYESDIAIEACPTCGGAWLDPGELEGIQESLERDYAKELGELPRTVARAYAQARDEDVPARSCPSCDVPLNRTEHGYCSQILVDACSECGGVWLDRGELEALEVFFERARLEARELRLGFFGGLVGS